jgi:hypothetical protein
VEVAEQQSEDKGGARIESVRVAASQSRRMRLRSGTKPLTIQSGARRGQAPLRSSRRGMTWRAWASVKPSLL